MCKRKNKTKTKAPMIERDLDDQYIPKNNI